MLSCVRQLSEYVEDLAAFVGREGLLLISVLVLFFVLGGGGRSLGLPSLFWRTTIDFRPNQRGKRLLVKTTRFFIGTSVGVLLGADALVGMLVESRDRVWTPEFFLRGFFVLCLGALLGVIAIWLWRPFGRNSDHGIPERIAWWDEASKGARRSTPARVLSAPP